MTSTSVKNTGEVRKQFIRKTAFPYHVLSRCKIKVGNIYIVTHGDDEASPFVMQKSISS